MAVYLIVLLAIYVTVLTQNSDWMLKHNQFNQLILYSIHIKTICEVYIDHELWFNSLTVMDNELNKTGSTYI